MIRFRIIFIVPVLLILSISLACTFNMGGPSIPTNELPAATQPVEEIRKEIIDSIQGDPEGGTVSITLTEAQLTSLVVEELNTSGNTLLQNPSVVLQDGQIEIYGEVDQGYVRGTVHMTVSAGIDAEGKPDLAITDADFGPLPVPAGILDNLSGMLEEGLISNLGANSEGFRLDQIVIDSGTMTVTGHPN